MFTPQISMLLAFYETLQIFGSVPKLWSGFLPFKCQITKTKSFYFDYGIMG